MMKLEDEEKRGRVKNQKVIDSTSKGVARATQHAATNPRTAHALPPVAPFLLRTPAMAKASVPSKPARVPLPNSPGAPGGKNHARPGKLCPHLHP